LTMNGNKKAGARFASAVAAPIPPGLIALWRGETDASDLIGNIWHGRWCHGRFTASEAGGATQGGRPAHAPSRRPAAGGAYVEAWVFPTAASAII
jgi:hypothetical protein